jgi:hypothetical protein
MEESLPQAPRSRHWCAPSRRCIALESGREELREAGALALGDWLSFEITVDARGILAWSARLKRDRLGGLQHGPGRSRVRT